MLEYWRSKVVWQLILISWSILLWWNQESWSKVLLCVEWRTIYEKEDDYSMHRLNQYNTLFSP